MRPFFISLGKAAHDKADMFDDADIARSLLYMISNDIGQVNVTQNLKLSKVLTSPRMSLFQISSLYALLHGIKCVYFGGFFLRHHPVSMHTVSYSVNYWSKGKVHARSE